jgi:hypothetical protein
LRFGVLEISDHDLALMAVAMGAMFPTQPAAG